MAIFGLFKKDKSKPPSSLASSSSVTADDAASSEDFVHARQTLQPPSIRGTDDGYTSSVQSVVSATPAKKRGKLPFGRKTPLSSKKSVSTLADHKLDTQHSPLRKLTLNLDTSTNSLPLQSAIFPSFHHSGSSPTLSSPLPASEPRTPARPHVQPMQKATDCPDSQKSNGNGRLFGWRERKKFRTPKPDEALIPPLSDDHSFNLRSFRHVLPDHPPESPQGSSPTQTAPKSSLTPPARPRGASVASSDSSQRISVAAFREAQARRSSTNLTSGSPSPTIRPLSVANSSVSDLALTKQTSRPTRSGTPSAPPMPTQRPVSSFKQPVPKRLSSSSDASSSEDSESEDGSPSRSRSRLSRQRTITKSYRAKSDLGHEPSGVDNSKHRENICSRSELGHGRPVRPSQPSHSPARGPPPSSFQKSVEAVLGTRSASLYKRQRASYSVGEINLTTTSARANMPKDSKSSGALLCVLLGMNCDLRALFFAANPLRSPAPNSDTSETTSDSDSSDDDAPLASLAQPRRPGSAMSLSSTSTSTPSRKPLINLNTRTNPISGKPLMDEKENVPSRSTLISPTNINSRLSKLTAAAGLGTHHISTASKSAENLSNASRIRPPFVESPQDISPASTVTVTPPVQTSSQQSVESARRASMPAVPTLQGAPSHTDDLRPIAVQGREQNSGFRVVSRPLKSPTSPLPQSSSYVPAHSQNPQRPSLGPRSATSSSVSGATNTSPRIQNTLPILNTRPLVPSPKPSTSSVPSSTPSSFHSRQSMDSTASSSNMSSRLGVQNSPQRPFLSEARRRDSPASSTGGSSNGPAPLTPADGSDYFSPNVRGNGDSPGDSSTRSTPQSAMKGARGHLQRASVSFQGDIPELDNDLTLRGKKSNHSLAKPKYSVEERENRRRDRRRSEAKAAIEVRSNFSFFSSVPYNLLSLVTSSTGRVPKQPTRRLTKTLPSIATSLRIVACRTT